MPRLHSLSPLKMSFASNAANGVDCGSATHTRWDGDESDSDSYSEVGET
jgi:hypothetical protein